MIVFHPTADASFEHREHASESIAEFFSTAQSDNLAAISKDAILVTGGLVIPKIAIAAPVMAPGVQLVGGADSGEETSV